MVQYWKKLKERNETDWNHPHGSSESSKAMSAFSRFSIVPVDPTEMTLLICTTTVPNRCRCRSYTQFSNDFASLPLRQGPSKDLTSFLAEIL